MSRHPLVSITAVAVVCAGLSPAWATCGGSVTFGQGANTDPATYAYVVTPGQGSLQDSLLGVWFAVGAGDQRVGAGHDSGSVETTRWLRRSGPGKFYMAGDWATGGADGCIAEAGFPPMAVAFADRDDAGDGFFAVACVGAGHDRFRLSYDFNFIDGGPGRSIELAPFPEMNVTREGGNVRVGWKRPEKGFYDDDQCDARSLVRFGLVYTEAAADAKGLAKRTLGEDPTRSWVRIPDTEFVAGTELTFAAPKPSQDGARIHVALGMKLDGGPRALVLPGVGARRLLPEGGE